MKILQCCGHREDRHIRLINDDAKSTICLTGKCRCNRKPVKSKAKKTTAGRAKRFDWSRLPVSKQ